MPRILPAQQILRVEGGYIIPHFLGHYEAFGPMGRHHRRSSRWTSWGDILTLSLPTSGALTDHTGTLGLGGHPSPRFYWRPFSAGQTLALGLCRIWGLPNFIRVFRGTLFEGQLQDSGKCGESMLDSSGLLYKGVDYKLTDAQIQAFESPNQHSEDYQLLADFHLSHNGCYRALPLPSRA